MEFGSRLYELRKKAGMSQEELAAVLDVTRQTVSKWEEGNTLPDVLMVCALADYFGTTTDALLGRVRELKKLVVMAGSEDRKLIEGLLKAHGFCAAAYAETSAEAAQRVRELAAKGILHIGHHDRLTEAERERTGKCNIGDCVYDEPADLRGNLDTILSMMESHF